MSYDQQHHWPHRPATADYNLEGQCLAIRDLVHEAGVDHADRRASAELAALASAAELLSRQLAHWFASRPCLSRPGICPD